MLPTILIIRNSTLNAIDLSFTIMSTTITLKKLAVKLSHNNLNSICSYCLTANARRPVMIHTFAVGQSGQENIFKTVCVFKKLQE